MKHTPGQWKYIDFGNAGTVVTSGPVDICQTHVYRPKEEQIANAKLIAAAPELLDALQQIIKINDANGKGTNLAYHVAMPIDDLPARLSTTLMSAIKQAQDAIKKATV